MSYKLQKYLEFKKNINNIYKNNVNQNNKKIKKQYLQSLLISIKSSPKK